MRQLGYTLIIIWFVQLFLQLSNGQQLHPIIAPHHCHQNGSPRRPTGSYSKQYATPNQLILIPSISSNLSQMGCNMITIHLINCGHGSPPSSCPPQSQLSQPAHVANIIEHIGGILFLKSHHSINDTHNSSVNIVGINLLSMLTIIALNIMEHGMRSVKHATKLNDYPLPHWHSPFKVNDINTNGKPSDVPLVMEIRKLIFLVLKMPKVISQSIQHTPWTMSQSISDVTTYCQPP